MKNLKVLFSAIAFLSLLVFTACEKQELTDNSPRISQHDQLSKGKIGTVTGVSDAEMPNQDHTDCYPTWSFGSYPLCFGDDFSLCEPMFPWDRPDFLVLNQATGTGTVNSEGTLVFNMDQSNFSPALVENIFATQTLNVPNIVEFPEEVINPLYEAAGMNAPSGPFTIDAGDYPVDILPSEVQGVIIIKVKITYEDWWGNKFELEIEIHIEN